MNDTLEGISAVVKENDLFVSANRIEMPTSVLRPEMKMGNTQATTRSCGFALNADIHSPAQFEGQEENHDDHEAKPRPAFGDEPLRPPLWHSPVLAERDHDSGPSHQSCRRPGRTLSLRLGYPPPPSSQTGRASRPKRRPTCLLIQDLESSEEEVWMVWCMSSNLFLVWVMHDGR